MRLGPKARRLLSSSAGALLAAGIVAAVNAVSHFAYLRLDLSRGRVYSVSAASKRLLRALPDPVLVTVYSSRELPPQILVVRNYLLDLLKEYRSGSGGKVRARLVELGEDPKAREEAVKSGISPVRFDIISKEKFEQQEGFLGLTLRYRDKRDTVPFLQETAGLEYDLTSRIKTLAAASKPGLGLVTAAGATGTGDLEPALAEQLQARYELRDVDLESVGAASAAARGLGALLVIGPQQALTERNLFWLDQYLLSGGALGALLDAKRVDMRAFFASDLDSGLQEFLKHHGLEVRPTLVMDAQSQPIQVSVQQGPFVLTNVVQYPPIVVSSDLSPEHPVTKGIDALALPFVSPVVISTRSAEARALALARSSRYSWAKSPAAARALSLNPFQFPPAGPNDEKGPFVLAAALTDSFRPFYAAPPGKLDAKGSLTAAAKPGRLLVVGTSKILGREFRGGEGGVHFFLNAVDWLSQDADLIAIRSKSVAFHPLREIPPAAKTAVRYGVMLLPPLAAVLAGLLRWRSRRRKIARARAEYGDPAAAPREAEPASAA